MNAEQDKRGCVILTGNSNPQLAIETGRLLDVLVLKPCSRFDDKETRVTILEELAKRPIFIVQSTSSTDGHSVNDSIIEILLMADAAKRMGVAGITAVIPYYGYARQDRQNVQGVPVSAELMARALKLAGVSRVLTVDLHSKATMGFFTGGLLGCFKGHPWENLSARDVLAPQVKHEIGDEGLNNLVVASTDRSGFSRAHSFREALGGAGIVIIDKERGTDGPKVVGVSGVDVCGRIALVVDDLVSTGTSLVNAVEAVKKRGAVEVYAAVTHGVFAKGSLQMIKNSPIKRLFITDTIEQREEALSSPQIVVASVASLLAEAIKRGF